MRCLAVVVLAGLAAARPGLLLADGVASDRDTPGRVTVSLAEGPKDRMARRALAQRTTLAIEKESLSAVLTRLATQAGVAIALDREALRRAGVDPERGVSIQVENATFDEALRRVLDAVKMQYELKSGVIHLLKKAKPLLPTEERERRRRAVEQALAKPVTIEFPGTSFDNVIDFLQDLTDVNIVSILEALGEPRVEEETPVRLKVRDVPLAEVLRLVLKGRNLDYIATERAVFICRPETVRRWKELQRALERPVTMSVENQPFGQVLMELQGRTGIVVKVAPEVLRLLPKGAQTPITLKVTETEARQVYEFLGGLLGLEFVTAEGVARYEATAALRALSAAPAVSAAPAEDRIVGRFVITGRAGLTTELYIRVSDLPAALRRRLLQTMIPEVTRHLDARKARE